jgi:hypothetical protein
MSDFLKYFFLAVCAAAFISVVVLNPLRLPVGSRLSLGLLIFVSAFLAALWIRRTKRRSRVASSTGVSVSGHATIGGDAVGRDKIVYQSPMASQTGVAPLSSVLLPQAPTAVDRNPFLTVVRVSQGDYVDFKWEMGKVRIEVSEIVKAEAASLLHAEQLWKAAIYVDSGGRIVYAGRECEKLKTNKYLVPQKKDVAYGDEELCAVFFFHADKGHFSFFRVYVEHINPTSGQVTLNVFFCWRTGWS